jgi:hypothetical protein
MMVLQNDKLMIYDEYIFTDLFMRQHFAAGVCDTITISRLLSAALSNPEN